jgi:tetratricopeptide (TPR) repeat protein
VGDDAQLFAVAEALIFYYNFAGELRAARELRGELLERAARLNDSVTTGRAHNALGHMAYLLGEWAAAREHWEASIDVRPDPRSAAYLQVDPWHTRGFLCTALWYLGYPDQARSSARQELRTARELAQPYPLTYAMLAACQVYLWCGDVPTAVEHSAAMVKIAEEYGFSFQLGRATLQRGAVLAGQGKVEQGIAEIRRGADQITATGAVVRSYQHAYLAEALRQTGSVAEALMAVAAGLSAVKRTGEGIGESELHRIQGELLWAVEGDSAGVVREAEACLVKAIEVARSQAARSWELRATMSLARLLDKKGKRVEARAMLSEIYNWFTEGFDTADLKDAKALLDELNN